MRRKFGNDWWRSAIYRFRYQPTAEFRWVSHRQDRLLLRSTVTAGWSYVLEHSTNLVDWTLVQTNTAAGAVLDFSVPQPGVNRFYRLLALEP